MTIERKIVRVDFVLQPNGEVVFCLGLAEFAPDPFEAGQMLVRAVEPNPMTPEIAKERYGIEMADLVPGIDDALAAENAAQRAAIAALDEQVAQLTALKTAMEAHIAELAAQNQAQEATIETLQREAAVRDEQVAALTAENEALVAAASGSRDISVPRD